MNIDNLISLFLDGELTHTSQTFLKELRPSCFLYEINTSTKQEELHACKRHAPGPGRHSAWPSPPPPLPPGSHAPSASSPPPPAVAVPVCRRRALPLTPHSPPPRSLQPFTTTTTTTTATPRHGHGPRQALRGWRGTRRRRAGSSGRTRTRTCARRACAGSSRAPPSS